MKRCPAAVATLTFALLTTLVPAATAEAEPPPEKLIDFSNAVVLLGPGLRPLEGADAQLSAALRHKVGKEFRIVRDWPDANGRAVIAVGTRSEGLKWTGPFEQRIRGGRWADGPEGFRIETDPDSPAVIVVGNDERGALFGVGRLLREMRLERRLALLPHEFHAVSAPTTKLRGHQLGYRPKTNSYDAWDRAQWLRYVSDLALFGTNAVELVPPRTDDDSDSPHFPLPPLEMMGEMSKVCMTFGLDVWVWFPVMDPVDTDPSKVEPLLKEWDEVFRKLPRLDAVFVPGGDPGQIPPKPLFAFLEKATEVLHRTHPKATMWVSPQGFDSKRMDEFLALTKAEPNWLTGIVFGPQVRVPLHELRKVIPARYPIRGYPDITHSRQCQHPVPDWDLAYAVTEGREAINPRPRAMATLVKAYAPETIGFITYSEGCNDDVNKVVWSTLGWDAETDVVDVLRQYARYHLGDRFADPFAQALMGLERNWSGPLLTNTGVEATLSLLQAIERSATPDDRLNWRFQQALYRGYYDAYIRDRLIQETALESRAREVLRGARPNDARAAIEQALLILRGSVDEPVSLDRRARVFELGEALFQSIRMQLSVSKYQAIAAERGANLDTIDVPLNNRLYVQRYFENVVSAPTTSEKPFGLITNLLNSANPGPGGFYDDLGDPANSPHLVRQPSHEADPMFVSAPFNGFMLDPARPTSWRHYAQTFYDAPLRLRYEGLDAKAKYQVVVVYSGDSPRGRIRLEADGSEVHPLIKKPDPIAPAKFEVPSAATADGVVELKWNQEPGRGGNGRGCQVAEVWLIRAEVDTNNRPR
jgi:hypothetical protein